MPRKLGATQSAALRQIVDRSPALRTTINNARRAAGNSGNVVMEIQRASARGNTDATTVLNLMRRAGASTGGGGSGSSGG